jgi:hypothetical protein
MSINFTSELIRLPYAFLEIRPVESGQDGLFDQVTAISLFDQITAKFRKKWALDRTDAMTRQVIDSFGDSNPRRLLVNYVDGSGAIISLSKLVSDHFATDASDLPQRAYLVIALGYKSRGVSALTVSGKLAELSNDARAACEQIKVTCSITSRLASPAKF